VTIFAQNRRSRTLARKINTELELNAVNGHQPFSSTALTSTGWVRSTIKLCWTVHTL